jgi:ribonucleoside-triphosphate reductase
MADIFTTHIKKSDGTEEMYNPDKVIVSIISVGVPYPDAVKFTDAVTKRVKKEDVVTSDALRAIIKDIVAKKYPDVAEKYAKNTMYIAMESGLLETFDINKIVQSLVQECGMTEKEAKKISRQAEKRLRKANVKRLTPDLIRETVCVVLLENGCEEERNHYRRLGMAFYDVTHLIEDVDTENANLQHNPETIHKHAADRITKSYLFASAPRHIVEAHVRGDIHIHDADYFMIRPNCLQHELPFFFKNGLRVDGSGNHTSVSGPAKNYMVAVLHAAKVMASSQTNMAGGQSLDNFNTYLAPFLAGLSAEQVKQAAQCFIFEMNQLYVARGGQTVFSSVNMDFEIPSYLVDQPAIGPGGKVVGKYGDFLDELQAFTNAFIDVLIEGDAVGKPHLFPNALFRVRDATFKDAAQRAMMLKVMYLFSKYGTPYILNLCPDYQHDAVNAMGCRTRLSGDWADKHGYDDPRMSTERCGNLHYFTLNLPRIAYQAKGNEDRALELLGDKLDLVYEALVFKRDTIKNRYEKGILPFLSQTDADGTPYYRFDDLTLTVGFAGLNEMVQFITGKQLHEDAKAYKLGFNYVKYMREYMNDKTEQTGLRFTLTQSPAETTCGRFAKLDYLEFDGTALVQGDKTNLDSLYYTNSSHMNVSSEMPLYERAKLDGAFHPLCNGGHIAHLFLGEATPDPEGLLTLTERLCKNTELGLFDYAKEMTLCGSCHTVVGGLKEQCPKCGSTDVTGYARITGYTQAVSGFNRAKVEEVRGRHKYTV